ncbi:MAG: hypothetical protein A3C07_00455 [Candidatus Sungbacteria bacterium RIFCSPHIGHO2_02_FULL_47_11]|uniref:Uncharacterized protein n=1 Tax=Candidatus Sungbacteria bacterium RIFCSPHIGHO2_02_FULL_47_11 TaxID=1802270 RepID=A0A1G2KL69_9BACT|nr:MAG: hypothetical protein A3C07_00455 [Candidatus Sungbacteria bacterium RIFCSPHIGHO2_02_FULL_47_11]
MNPEQNKIDPQEEARIRKERTIHDAELFKKGGDYVPEKGGLTLEIPQEEINQLREKGEGKEKIEQLEPVLALEDIQYLKEAETKSGETREIKFKYDDRERIIEENHFYDKRKAVEVLYRYNNGDLAEEDRIILPDPSIKSSSKTRILKQNTYKGGRLTERNSTETIEATGSSVTFDIGRRTTGTGSESRGEPTVHYTRTRFLEMGDPDLKDGKPLDELSSSYQEIFVKDNEGRVVFEKNRDHVKKYEYSPQGKNTKITEIWGDNTYETEFTYDDKGRELSRKASKNRLPTVHTIHNYQELANGNYRDTLTHVDFDEYGRRKKEDKGAVSEYDNNGNLLYAKHGKEVYKMLAYDALGKLRKETERRHPSAVPFGGATLITEYEYDHEGRLMIQKEKRVKGS